METLKSTETLPEDSSREPPGSLTLDSPGGAPDPPPIRAAESAVSGPRPSPKRASGRAGGRTHAAAVSPAPPVEIPVRKPVAEAKPLATTEPDHDDPRVGSPPGGSSEKEKAKENLAGKQEEGSGGGESPFAVGDFVWVKSKSQTWWPGQVCNPALVSDHVKKAYQKDHCILVTFFGRGSFCWCEPTKLKPFIEEFHPMAKQSRSKSFTGAVRDTLAETLWCLESELTCCCVPAEARLGLEKHNAVNAGGKVKLSITNYAPVEFLERLLDVARDISKVNLLEATMLQSWVSAFGKGCLSSGSFVYRPHRRTAELVDKVDLDDPPSDSLAEDEGQEEFGKKPQITEEELFRSRKKRSMAKLMAEMDLDVVELNDSEEETEAVPNKPSASNRKKKNENEKGLDVENGCVNAEEETGSGKRERKKSKYLSPPYTYASGYTKLSSSPKSTELKLLTSPKSMELKTPNKATDTSQALLSGAPTISKCNSDVFQEVEDNKFDSTSAGELFSEFLSTALNPLHLKWNRSAKMVRVFFSIYRSSVFSEASDFDTYQKHLGDCGGTDGKSANKDMSARSEEGMSRGKRRKRKGVAHDGTPSNLVRDATDRSEQVKAGSKRKMRKEGADGVTPLDLGEDTTNRSEKGKVGKMRKGGASEGTTFVPVHGASDCSEHGKVGPEEKMRKTASNMGVLVDLNIVIANGSEEGKSLHEKKKLKDGANGERVIDLGHEPINFAEAGKKRQKMTKEKESCNEKSPIELASVLLDCSEDGNLEQKKKSKDGPSAENLVDSGCEIIIGAEVGKSRQKRKKKDATTSGNPAALLLTFAPGIALPSKDDLISKFSRYGGLIETETELFTESSCARVVFAKSTEAEKAFNSRDKSGVFSPPIPSYRLRYLPATSISALPPIPVPKPPLPSIRKGLEKMISTLTGSSSEKDAGSSDGLEPEARDNLVSDMRGLLTKVNKMLNGSAAGISS